MHYFRRTFPMTIILLFMVVLAACGGSTNTGSTATTPTPAPTATATSSSAGALVKTATATVKGTSETILTDAQGKTLYYFTPDTATTSACTGGCAQNWPPLIATTSATLTSDPTLSGKLTTVTTANGIQVACNGHLLYTFAADSGPGQTNGEGVLGKWFVATPNLAQGSGSGSSVQVKTATATVQGKSETILTDAQGKTLYYFTPDTATTSACTGGCSQNWPALVMTGSGTPTGDSSLTGKLTVVTTANGNQIAYNGHLLYTFAADSGPGQTNGEGVGGKWFVATPTIPAM